MVVRILGAACLAAGSAAAAAAAPPATVLHDGQTRWFLPGSLHPGARVVCVVSGRPIAASVPPPRANTAPGVDRWRWAHGVLIRIALDSRPNGAVEARCGSAAATSPVRRPDAPYVVDQNGFAALPGANTLARVRALFPDGVASARGRTCRLTWRSLGLVASFAGSTCRGAGRMLGATARGSRWSSLTGVHVGDRVARMAWESQSARLLSGTAGDGTWLLGRARGGSRLVAVVTRGRVASLVLEGR